MRFIPSTSGVRVMLVALTVSASGAGLAQQQDAADNSVVVNGVKTPGPDIKGVITARNDNKVKITTADGANTIIAVDEGTKVRSGGGLFGFRSKLAQDALLNGLPVTVKTWHAGDGPAGGELVASRISFKNSDLKTA